MIKVVRRAVLRNAVKEVQETRNGDQVQTAVAVVVRRAKGVAVGHVAGTYRVTREGGGRAPVVTANEEGT